MSCVVRVGFYHSETSTEVAVCQIMVDLNDTALTIGEQVAREIAETVPYARGAMRDRERRYIERYR